MAVCRKTSTQKLFVFEEKRSKLTLENPRQLVSTKVDVDGCEITDNGIRCDYMHIIPEREIYIELKGQDIPHAVAQIERTISLLSTDRESVPKTSYIICSRSPLSSTEIQSFQLAFRKKYNSRLVVKSSPYTDSY